MTGRVLPTRISGTSRKEENRKGNGRSRKRSIATSSRGVRHGIYISAKEGRFIDCNPTLLEMLGYEKKEEFLKIDIANDLYIHPEERLVFQGRIEKEGFVKDFEWSSRRKAGKDHRPSDSPRQKGRKGDDHRLRRDHHRYLGKKADGKGAPGGHEFLTRLIESSVDGIIVADMDGNVLIFNKGAENMLGYTAEEVLGKMNIRSVYPPGLPRK